MRVDLHNHTTRCNHATGTIEEYIQRAIELGVEIYGFSEHAPLEIDPHYRLDFEQMREYEADILNAKAKYQDQIDIRLGYEVDYLPNYLDERILNAKVDYLIGSVHFLDNWGFDNPEFIKEYQNRDIDAIWQEYFGAIESMANTKYFDIVGHLDLIKVFKYMPSLPIETLAQNALEAIKEAKMAIEINPAGLRKPIGEQYPSRQLLERVYEMGIEITFGSDAHRVVDVGLGYDEVTTLAKTIGFKEVVAFKDRQKEYYPL
ncbi:MAG: histidinol phosphate phosphatase [Sulfurovum sp. PC08-66]|jgi:histidinol-phosphatase (PHP family)|nr:MAG: histidinol phosphate phosphatase [Sulfurovum sp. PC08-66]